ncbi:FAD-dependent monooxygenase [Streptomyces phaeochromogenes]
MDVDVDVDVVVVGGGPAGALLAGELGLAGVRTLVVERLTEQSDHKWLGVQTRTLEEFELRGVLEELLDGAPLLHQGNFASLPTPLAYEGLDSRHPHAAYRPREDVEEILTARARKLGAEFRRGHELVRLGQDEGGVTAGIRGPDARSANPSLSAVSW